MCKPKYKQPPIPDMVGKNHPEMPGLWHWVYQIHIFIHGYSSPFAANKVTDSDIRHDHSKNILWISRGSNEDVRMGGYNHETFFLLSLSLSKMYVHTYIFLYTYIHTYIYTYVCYICIYIQTLYPCTYIYIYVYTSISIYLSIYLPIHIYIYKHLGINMHYNTQCLPWFNKQNSWIQLVSAYLDVFLSTQIPP